MIHPHNNDYDLESIEVQTSIAFAVGGTRIGRAADRNWLVHWVDSRRWRLLRSMSRTTGSRRTSTVASGTGAKRFGSS